MPIPLLPLHLQVAPPSPSGDGTVSLDSEVLLQLHALIAQHVPGMSLPFSIASVVVVCGGYTNKCPSLPLRSLLQLAAPDRKRPAPLPPPNSLLASVGVLC